MQNACEPPVSSGRKQCVLNVSGGSRVTEYRVRLFRIQAGPDVGPRNDRNGVQACRFHRSIDLEFLIPGDDTYIDLDIKQCQGN